MQRACLLSGFVTRRGGRLKPTEGQPSVAGKGDEEGNNLGIFEESGIGGSFSLNVGLVVKSSFGIYQDFYGLGDGSIPSIIVM